MPGEHQLAKGSGIAGFQHPYGFFHAGAFFHHVLGAPGHQFGQQVRQAFKIGRGHIAQGA